MSRIAKLIIVFVILLSGLAFHLKNNQMIELNYYVGVLDMPLSWLVVIMLFIGAMLGVLASLPMIIKLKQQKLKLERQIKSSEKEINNLRVIKYLYFMYIICLYCKQSQVHVHVCMISIDCQISAIHFTAIYLF